jgi:hypothetical protein
MHYASGGVQQEINARPVYSPMPQSTPVLCVWAISHQASGRRQNESAFFVCAVSTPERLGCTDRLLWGIWGETGSQTAGQLGWAHHLPARFY